MSGGSGATAKSQERRLARSAVGVRGGRPEVPLRVFTEELIEWMRQWKEAPTAAEAELAGPWDVRRLDGGAFGVFRTGDSEYEEECPFESGGRHLALLLAAALEGIGRGSTFRLHPEAREGRYPLLREGSEVGSAAVFLADVCPALDALEAVIRSPSALALVLEAAGPTALVRAGRELGLRLVAVRDEGGSCSIERTGEARREGEARRREREG